MRKLDSKDGISPESFCYGKEEYTRTYATYQCVLTNTCKDNLFEKRFSENIRQNAELFDNYITIIDVFNKFG